MASNYPASSQITALGSVAVDTAFSFAPGAGDMQTVTITADKTYSATGMSATIPRTISVIFTASGNRTLAWNSSLVWIGPKPASLATGVSGILVMSNKGSALSDVICSWSELGAG